MSRFEELGVEIGQLVAKKNKAYGSAFQVSADLLKLFFPNGVQPSQYTDLLLIARVCDKLTRIANQKDAFGESPWLDVAGYGLLGVYADECSKSTGRNESIDGQAVVVIPESHVIHTDNLTTHVDEWSTAHTGEEVRSAVEEVRTNGGNDTISQRVTDYAVKTKPKSACWFPNTCNCKRCKW